MQRDRFRFTGGPTFLGGTDPLPGGVTLPNHYSAPRPAGFTLGGEGATVQRFHVLAIFGDYITAQPAEEDGSPVGNSLTYYIAKPPDLRRSTYDGETIGGWTFSVPSADGSERIATWAGGTSADGFTGASTYQEIIDPAYEVAQSDIFAISTTSPGYTGVRNAEGGLITLLDLNVSARKWQMRLKQVTVCIDGVARTMIIRGSAVF